MATFFGTNEVQGGRRTYEERHSSKVQSRHCHLCHMRIDI